MLVVKVRKATQVLRVSLDRQEQKDCVVLTDLVDRLVLLDLLDLLDSLVSFQPVVSTHQLLVT